MYVYIRVRAVVVIVNLFHNNRRCFMISSRPRICSKLNIYEFIRRRKFASSQLYFSATVALGSPYNCAY